MCDTSNKECDAVLEDFSLERKDVTINQWKEEIINYAKGFCLFLLLNSHQAVAMCDTSNKECDAVLEDFSLDHKDVTINQWKEGIINYAKGFSCIKKHPSIKHEIAHSFYLLDNNHSYI